MTDQRNDDAIDTVPEELGSNPDSPPPTQDDDARSDLEQAVDARRDAIENGEGGHQTTIDAPAGGSDGIVKNQEGDGQ